MNYKGKDKTYTFEEMAIAVGMAKETEIEDIKRAFLDLIDKPNLIKEFILALDSRLNDIRRIQRRLTSVMGKENMPFSGVCRICGEKFNNITYDIFADHVRMAHPEQEKQINDMIKDMAERLRLD